MNLKTIFFLLPLLLSTSSHADCAKKIDHLIKISKQWGKIELLEKNKAGYSLWEKNTKKALNKLTEELMNGCNPPATLR